MPAMSFKCLSLTCRIVFSIILPCTEVRLTIRAVITRIFFLALLENLDICQLSGDWYLSGFPRQLKDNCERSCDDINELFEYPKMNYIGPHLDEMIFKGPFQTQPGCDKQIYVSIYGYMYPAEVANIHKFRLAVSLSFP